MTPAPEELGFTYRAAKDGAVRIFRHGQEVTVLRGKAAAQFLGKADGVSWTAVGRFKIKIPENGEATVNAVVEPSALAL